MDKNIAAILRKETKTIGVVFEPDVKQYTYVTDLDVKVGDYVVVDAREELKVCKVARVDSDLEIEPNSNTKFKWVVDVVDMAQHEANASKNKELEQTLAKAYRSNTRRAFADSILANLTEDERAKTSALLGNNQIA